MATANNALDTTLLNEQQVARLLNVSIATIRRWRLLRRGPIFIKLSSLVRYRREDVDAWLKSQPTGGNGESGTTN